MKRTLTIISLAVALTACSPITSAETVDDLETVDNFATVDTSDTAVGELAAFDASTIHTIAIEVDDADVAWAIETYLSTSEKEWISATVTIDGTTYQDVGIRLKGNSSLRDINATDPAETLPWLIRLNKYIDGQTHQGYEDFVVRSNTTTTALNEAVALQLLGEAGLATEQAVSTAFSVNGSDEVLRLVIDHPDDDRFYETAFGDDGAIYKAESGGSWAYLGDDPELYVDSFDQEGGSSVADLTPVIELLEFIGTADDATFANELDTYLDVDSFATYLAMMDIVDNFDDLDGPGNNGYLWYDVEADLITVVPWDLNLAFGARNEVGGGAQPGGARPEGVQPGGAIEPGGREPGVRPDAGQVGGQQSGQPNSGNNPLVERFMEQFGDLYDEQFEALTTDLIDSGTAEQILNGWVDLLTTEGADLVDRETVTAEAAAINAYLT